MRMAAIFCFQIFPTTNSVFHNTDLLICCYVLSSLIVSQSYRTRINFLAWLYVPWHLTLNPLSPDTFLYTLLMSLIPSYPGLFPQIRYNNPMPLLIALRLSRTSFLRYICINNQDPTLKDKNIQLHSQTDTKFINHLSLKTSRVLCSHICYHIVLLLIICNWIPCQIVNWRSRMMFIHFFFII